MKTVLQITGSSGFAGQNLIKYIQAKTDFHLILTNREQLNEPEVDDYADAIVHLAGKAHDLKAATRTEEYYRVNFELTKKIYDKFLQSKAKKFIFLSSVKAAADHVDEPLNEDYLPNPKTDYGRSKLMAENYIKDHQLPHGKAYYILRPCMIHGPGNKGNLNLLYQMISKGVPYPLAAFENKRSFLSIENLSFVILEILNRYDIPSGIYNIADDEPLSTTEVVSVLANALQRPPRLLNIPISIIRYLAKIGDRCKLPLNTERLTKLTENYVVSNKKIKDVLKKELPLSARDGILITARSFKDA